MTSTCIGGPRNGLTLDAGNAHTVWFADLDNPYQCAEYRRSNDTTFVFDRFTEETSHTDADGVEWIYNYRTGYRQASRKA